MDRVEIGWTEPHVGGSASRMRIIPSPCQGEGAPRGLKGVVAGGQNIDAPSRHQGSTPSLTSSNVLMADTGRTGLVCSSRRSTQVAFTVTVPVEYKPCTHHRLWRTCKDRRSTADHVVGRIHCRRADRRGVEDAGQRFGASDDAVCLVGGGVHCRLEGARAGLGDSGAVGNRDPVAVAHGQGAVLVRVVAPPLASSVVIPSIFVVPVLVSVMFVRGYFRSNHSPSV